MKWISTKPTSHWQQGCDDAKAGRLYRPPTSEADFSGYRKGYVYGKSLSPPPDTKVGTPGVMASVEPEAYAGPVTWTPDDEKRLDEALAKRAAARAARVLPGDGNG